MLNITQELFIPYSSPAVAFLWLAGPFPVHRVINTDFPDWQPGSIGSPWEMYRRAGEEQPSGRPGVGRVFSCRSSCCQPHRYTGPDVGSGCCLRDNQQVAITNLPQCLDCLYHQIIFNVSVCLCVGVCICACVCVSVCASTRILKHMCVLTCPHSAGVQSQSFVHARHSFLISVTVEFNFHSEFIS